MIRWILTLAEQQLIWIKGKNCILLPMLLTINNRLYCNKKTKINYCSTRFIQQQIFIIEVWSSEVVRDAFHLDVNHKGQTELVMQTPIKHGRTIVIFHILVKDCLLCNDNPVTSNYCKYGPI